MAKPRGDPTGCPGPFVWSKVGTKRGGRAPSTFGGRPEGRDDNNVGACISTPQPVSFVSNHKPLQAQESLIWEMRPGDPRCYNPLRIKPSAPYPLQGKADGCSSFVASLGPCVSPMLRGDLGEVAKTR